MSEVQLRRSPEFDLITRYFSRHADSTDDGLLLSVGDDAAVFSPPDGFSLVFSIDTVVEGRHFPHEFPPYYIARRALGSALSDLAAMGASAHHFTLALSLPQLDEMWLTQFSNGLYDLAKVHGARLVGGDTTRGPLTITIQVHGLAPTQGIIRRDGAKAGDSVYVSGVLGDAAAGLKCCDGINESSSTDQKYLFRRFASPEPRIELGVKLRGYASAMLDVSDGLLADAQQLAHASGVDIELLVDKIPLSKALINEFGASTALDFALSGGDDYELLVVVPEENRAEVESLGLTRIGSVKASSGSPEVRLLSEGGELSSPKQVGFDHFG